MSGIWVVRGDQIHFLGVASIVQNKLLYWEEGLDQRRGNTPLKIILIIFHRFILNSHPSLILTVSVR